jgi:transposase InsO family protein
LEKYELGESTWQKEDAVGGTDTKCGCPCLALEHFENLAAARLSVFKYIETLYNTERLHQTLGYKSPNHFETDHAPVVAA